MREKNKELYEKYWEKVKNLEEHKNKKQEEKAVNTTTLGVILLLAVLFLIVMYIVFKIQELKIKRLEQANKHLLEKFMELLEVVNETTDLEITVVENGEKYKMRK